MTQLTLDVFKFSICCGLFYLIGLSIVGNIFPNILTPNLNSDIGIGNTLFRLQEAEEQTNIDILILGSSHAYRGFDTRIFRERGFTTFNLGTSSQTPMQTKLLLDRYLEKMNPKLIIFEVYPEVFEVDGVESILDLLATSQLDCGLVAQTFKVNNVKAYNTLFFSVFRRMLGTEIRDTSRVLNPDEKYIEGGYVEKANRRFYNTSKKSLKRWNFEKEQIKHFEEIISTLRGRDLLLVQAPITKALFESYSNNIEIDSFFMNYGNYLNYNRELTLTDSLHFYDSHHLNQDGVEIFNSKLLSKLEP